ncbi:MAG: ABC transporter permease [Candidatus Aminicenantes bacterium]|nr:ABC transporter permease [Candidatus Aminicenantes bacterium]
MIRHYLLTALRHLKKTKGFSAINIAGFAVGIACCILLALYVRIELDYDRYHQQADRIFRLGVRGVTGSAEFVWGDSNAVAAQALRDDYPEVVATARIGDVPPSSVQFGDTVFFEDRFLYADHSIFDIFSWPWRLGDQTAALTEPFSVVLTESLARKYFGRESPLGRTLLVNRGESYTVRGVIADAPRLSSLRFDALCSFATLYARSARPSPILVNWLDFNFQTYVLLRRASDAGALQAKLPALLEKHAGALMKLLGMQVVFFLQPLRDIHLRKPGDGAILYVYIFSTVALLVLLIACLNFMNLSTARSAQRAREVGVRKVFGSDRRNLVVQFLGESTLTSFLSFLLGLALVSIVLPLLRPLAGLALELPVRVILRLLPGFLGLVLVTGFVAGSYPAIFLSGFRPASVLKGDLRRGSSGAQLRSILVVVQFTVSLVLMIGMGIVVRQLHFLKNKDLGFDPRSIVVLPLQKDTPPASVERLKKSLLENPAILGAAASSALPGRSAPFNSKLPQGFALNQVQNMSDMNADADFIPTLGIKIVAGRNFSREYPADPSQSVLINETAARQFGWTEAVGKTIVSGDTSRRTVIGVIRDFHLEPLTETIRPLFLASSPAHPFVPLRHLLVKISPRDMAPTLEWIRGRWVTEMPGVAWTSFFLDESLTQRLSGMEQSRNIFSAFTYLAVFISCLGLLGMSAYTTEQRTREVGIRKILGCSSLNIFVLLGRDLLKHILIAAAVSVPLAYVVVGRWLRGFPYRTGISSSSFVLSAGLVLVIGLATISFHVLKAALTDPVRSLRHE